MARTMLKGAKLSNIFWKEVVHIVIHILNKGFLRKKSDKTPSELWKCRPTSVKDFRIFGIKCYIKRNEDNLGNLDPRTCEGIFLGYPFDNKAYRCFNLRASKIVTSVDVTIYDDTLAQIYTNLRIKEEDDDLEIEQHQTFQNEE